MSIHSSMHYSNINDDDEGCAGNNVYTIEKSLLMQIFIIQLAAIKRNGIILYSSILLFHISAFDKFVFTDN
jgi:hypothetical protein